MNLSKQVSPVQQAAFMQKRLPLTDNVFLLAHLTLTLAQQGSILSLALLLRAPK